MLAHSILVAKKYKLINEIIMLNSYFSKQGYYGNLKIGEDHEDDVLRFIGQKINMIKSYFTTITLFFLKFRFFKKIFKFLVSIYLIDKGYCVDWDFLKNKSQNNLFQGENIFISKFDLLNIRNCIDVGSNIGEYSLEILKNLKTNVIAFEPMPGCVKYLKKIHNKYGSRFSYYGYALSNKNSEDVIYYGKSTGGLSTLEKSANEIDYLKKNINIIKIEKKKLDNYLNNEKFDNIDFIKIDVEGHEFKVLEGGMSFINKHKVKLIQIEFNIHHLYVGNSILQFSKILKNYVTAQMNLINGKLVVVAEECFLSNIYQLSNFVFIEKKFFDKNKKILLN